ncbi:MAG: cadherin repeat domain-containing protein, partial [Porticoccaceae bacterium]|nr:cadherin repeat domain-containing protein [Porticoccaceae bacterium]
MKTTTQDSNHNQENSTPEVDAKNQQAENTQSVELDSSANLKADNPVAGDQLALPLAVTDTIALASGESDEAKKRKQEKEEAEQKAKSDKQEIAEAVESEADTDGQSEVQDEALTDESAEESLISDALDGQAGSEGGSGLSMTTIFLSAAGIFGAASYYKNSNKDLPPTFTSGGNADNVAENSGAGQVVYTAVAVNDLEEDAFVTYSLSADSDSALVINSDTGEVTLGDDPDHEVQDQYVFTVIAADEAGNQSERSVTLVITDLDDAAPTITSTDTAVVDENSGAGQVVYTATADDSADISEGYSFSLAAGSDAALAINSDTGEVTLSDDPDHEVQSQYSFAVVATDAAGNASAAQSVTLEINDLDEIPPTVTSSNLAATIDENSGAGQVIYTATADDSADISDGFTFSLAVGSDAGLTIDANTGEVTLTADPDYEAQSQYSFAVMATDAAGNASASQSVTLDINNLDDTPPTITSSVSVDMITENSSAGQLIYVATADDSADVSSGPVVFSLSADSDSALSIDANTGEVTLLTDPDHENQTQYSFTVIAADGANNSSEQALTLNVEDIDDIAPLFLSSSNVNVDENAGAGQVVYTAVVDDSLDVSDGVTFSLLPGHNEALSINPVTGEVLLSEAPDYENKTEYSFTVLAENNPNLGSVLQVILTVNNVDDTAPSITSDVVANIDENNNAGQVIYTATADDSADIESGSIVYSLAEGSDAGLSIDANSGEVILADNLDHEVQGQYNFAVIATDAVGNDSASQSVTVDINDLDDTPPTITSGDTAAAIDENSGAGQVIYTATADDSADISDGFTFSLAEGSDTELSIDAATGQVTLAVDPDQEVQGQYSFAVIATDAAGNVSAAQSVTLDINDLDDSAPIITSDDSAVAIDENSGAGQVIYTATADDSADLSDSMAFSLDAGSDAGLTIDAVTGEVTLTTDPNHELQSEYSFAVIATDAAGNPSTAQSVTLGINDLDETAPTFNSLNTASIFESRVGNNIVYRAVVTDDQDISAGVSFQLSEDSDDGLSINSAGEVVLTPVPDFESKSSYVFTVIADDGVNQSQQAVNLSVIDQDLDAPIFISLNAVTVDENIGVSQVIYSALSQDESIVTFSLLEGHDAGLVIDANSGEVTLDADPDHEVKTEYSFTVVATDTSNNVSEQMVTVTINDLDDAAPTITSDASVSAIDENSGAGQVIYTATANDDGDDISGAVAFSLAEGSDAGLSINTVTGVVTLAGNPDYEAQNQYNFTVVATDEAGNQSAGQSISLDINNLDDTAPIITSDVTVASIDENTPADQVIYTATAEDLGDGTDGSISFSLAESSDAGLSIDEITGAVTLAVAPNYESKAQYNFTVLATDSAGNQDQQELTLNLN